MKYLVVAALIAFLTSSVAHAADASCSAKAAEKKLAGAAKTSFIKKCEQAPSSAKDTCASKAAGKKLFGAARNSFVKKCEKDTAAGK